MCGIHRAKLCEFRFGGIVFEIGNQLSGTSAKKRTYYRWFYCTSCLDDKYFLLPYADTSYDDLKYNATPMVKP